MKKYLAAIVALSLTAAAQAFPEGYGFLDTDPLNNLPGGADPLNIASVDAAVGNANLAAGGGDVDWYTVDMLAGETLTAITTPMAPFPSVPDTVMAVFLPGPILLNGSDDAGGDAAGGGAVGPTRGSAVRYQATFNTKVLLAVSGYADFNFDGIDDFSGLPHTEVGRYLLTVSIVPEPASLIGLALAGLLAARRR